MTYDSEPGKSRLSFFRAARLGPIQNSHSFLGQSVQQQDVPSDNVGET